MDIQRQTLRKDKKISEALKSLIEDFWINNANVSPNEGDVVRRIGSQNHDPHAKHFLDSSQTWLFAKFIGIYPQIQLSQRIIEMSKPFYVNINHTCTTCCCRIYIEFSNHFDILKHICMFLHSEFVFQDCDMNEPPRSSREFISKFLCEIGDERQFYKTSCLDGTCLFYDSL